MYGTQTKQCYFLHSQSEVGTQLYETLGLEGEIDLAIRKLKEWAAPRPVEKNLLTLSDTVYINPEPLGVVLIIGAWNYPWAVTVQPLIGAIAAGTAAVWLCESAGSGATRFTFDLSGFSPCQIRGTRSVPFVHSNELRAAQNILTI